MRDCRHLLLGALSLALAACSNGSGASTTGGSSSTVTGTSSGSTTSTSTTSASSSSSGSASSSSGSASSTKSSSSSGSASSSSSSTSTGSGTSSGSGTSASASSSGTTGGLTPSANCAESPPAAQIGDASGNAYTIVGGQVAQNGVVDTRTSEVTLLVYDAGLVYQLNGWGAWYSTDGTGWPLSTWTDLGDNGNPCASSTGGTSGGASTSSGGSGSSTSSSGSGSSSSSSSSSGGNCGAPLAPPPGYTASQLIFDDQFCGTTLNAANWNTFVASRASQCTAWNGTANGGSSVSGPGAYDDEAFEPSQVSVNNGLSLTAVDQSSQSGFPWTSGAVCTCGKFEFTGGYLQIGMQQPDTTTGMWPGLWMLPGSTANSTTDNFEIDLQEGGYTATGSANDTEAYHEHDNNPGGTTCGGVTPTGIDLAAGFHVYGVAWVAGQSLTYYVDGTQVGQITSSQCGISDEPMEIILDLQVAINTSGWHTLEGPTTPSPSVMQVSEVQVYQ